MALLSAYDSKNSLLEACSAAYLLSFYWYKICSDLFSMMRFCKSLFAIRFIFFFFSMI